MLPGYLYLLSAMEVEGPEESSWKALISAAHSTKTIPLSLLWMEISENFDYHLPSANVHVGSITG
jgi:hypothetical protein